MRSKSFVKLASEFPELTELLQRLTDVLDSLDSGSVIIAREIALRLSGNQDQISTLLGGLEREGLLRSEYAALCDSCDYYSTNLDDPDCENCSRRMAVPVPIEPLYRFSPNYVKTSTLLTSRTRRTAASQRAPKTVRPSPLTSVSVDSPRPKKQRPMDSPARARPLFEFIRERFDNDSLQRFLDLDLGAGILITQIQWNKDLDATAHRVAKLLLREAYVDANFFVALRERFPRLHSQIDILAQQLVLDVQN